MIQIDDPPTVTACATCMRPLLWLYSARTSRWVAFVPAEPRAPAISHAIVPHGCREPTGWPSWRQTRRGSPPTAEYRAVRQQLKNRTDKETT